jgi:hypothetical protein
LEEAPGAQESGGTAGSEGEKVVRKQYAMPAGDGCPDYAQRGAGVIASLHDLQG